MILYDNGNISFVLRWEGSTLPTAALYALPSFFLAVGFHYLMKYRKDEMGLGFVDDTNHAMIWSAFVIVLGILLGVRTNKAYNRFWEGITLVQQMRAEWFEATSNLMAFSMVACKQDSSMLDQVHQFQYVLIRLMSLMHGVALRQIGGNNEEFDVLDIASFDSASMRYLAACEDYDFNRVEVLLHWIQVLVTDAHSSGVIAVAAPILTRAYQTLSRGMVNLHNARKLADVPFPFPLSQMIIVLMLVVEILVPFLVSTVLENAISAGIVSFIPMFGMWGITFVSNELEQPFGTDPNDLPLSSLQFDFNTTLLMLMDKECTRAPSLVKEKMKNIQDLRRGLAQEGGSDPVNCTSGPAYVANEMARQQGSCRKSVASISKHLHAHQHAAKNHHDELLMKKAKLKGISSGNLDDISGPDPISQENNVVSWHDLEEEREERLRASMNSMDKAATMGHTFSASGTHGTRSTDVGSVPGNNFPTPSPRADSLEIRNSKEGSLKSYVGIYSSADDSKLQMLKSSLVNSAEAPPQPSQSTTATQHDDRAPWLASPSPSPSPVGVRQVAFSSGRNRSTSARAPSAPYHSPSNSPRLVKSPRGPAPLASPREQVLDAVLSGVPRELSVAREDESDFFVPEPREDTLI